jgi:hypothetical protein
MTQLPDAVLVRSPMDFERTLPAHEYGRSVVVQLTDEGEEFCRRTLDEIFVDLQYIESGDSALLKAYLDGIADPLQQLRNGGLLILALGQTVKRSIPNLAEPIPWRRVSYLVVPSEGYFRRGTETSGVVHRFTDQCEAAIADVAASLDGSVGLSVWPSNDMVTAQLEGNVPWCQQCCLRELSGG